MAGSREQAALSLAVIACLEPRPSAAGEEPAHHSSQVIGKTPNVGVGGGARHAWHRQLRRHE